MLVEKPLASQLMSVGITLLLALGPATILTFIFDVPQESILWALMGWGIYIALSNLSFFCFPKFVAMHIISTSLRAGLYNMLENYDVISKSHQAKDHHESLYSQFTLNKKIYLPTDWAWGLLFYGYYIISWSNNVALLGVLCVIVGIYTMMIIEMLQQNLVHPEQDYFIPFFRRINIVPWIILCGSGYIGSFIQISGAGTLLLPPGSEYSWILKIMFLFNLFVVLHLGSIIIQIIRKYIVFYRVSMRAIEDDTIQRSTTMYDLFTHLLLNGSYNNFLGGLALKNALAKKDLWESFVEREFLDKPL